MWNSRNHGTEASIPACFLFFRKQTQSLSCNNSEDKVSPRGRSSQHPTGQESNQHLDPDNARNRPPRPARPTGFRRREEAAPSRQLMDCVKGACVEFYQLLFQRLLGCPQVSLLSPAGITSSVGARAQCSLLALPGRAWLARGT